MTPDPVDTPTIVVATADQLLDAVGTMRLSELTGLEPGASGGELLWTGQIDQRPIVVAWEWVRIDGGANALADPLGIASNVSLVDTAGEAVSMASRVRTLNLVVNRLNWLSLLPPPPLAPSSSSHQQP